MSRARIVFSTSEPYFHAAEQELRSAFTAATVERLASETGCLAADDLNIADVAEMCRRQPIVFVRHLMQEVVRLPLTGRPIDLDRLSATVLEVAANCPAGPELALQVWVSGRSPAGVRADEVRRRVAEELKGAGYAVARAEREWNLSICVTPAWAILGCNRSADALADWPGGRVRLARDAGQISRAELKLDELIKLFDLPLPAGGVALDLGASPGGWTRIARRAGLTVWAVDPGDLDPRLATDPGVHHVRTTAGPYLATSEPTFDLVLNDMRMTPSLSCAVMLNAARRLKPGGLAILTLKITPRGAVKTVHQSLQTLERAYEIVHARQLYHNRNEVTVVARRPISHPDQLAHTLRSQSDSSDFRE